MVKDEILKLGREEFFKSVKMEYRRYYEPFEEPESVYPDGRINIDCPCLHSALAHQCGYLIRKALLFKNKFRKAHWISSKCDVDSS
uniref:SWIM-type domain-containing protein n=1 Tax=Caenorhabditis tropicalis TaxID=1561998 RepID=A0A1I7T3V3_9PELO